MATPQNKPAGSKFRQQSDAEAAAEEKAERPYIKTPEAWDGMSGQEFGGASGILDLKVGEVAGVFVYTGHQQVTTDLGETTVHTGLDEDNNQWRMPIQATFLRAVDQARLGMGDKFAVKRQEDQIKKRGKGAGNPMAIYAIKVLERAAPNPGA